MNALVVINPEAGGGKGAVIGERVRNYFADKTDKVCFVEAPSLAQSLEQTQLWCSTNEPELLICVGGDGLVHDLLPILIEFSLPLLVIPAGTGNDFARTLGLHGSKLSTLLELPNTQGPERMNLVLVSHNQVETPFVQILSTGFDSVVNAQANNYKAIKGRAKYIMAVLQKVWSFSPVDFTITIDGKTQNRRAMLVCIANGTSYGAGMKVVPHAKNDDDLLDLMVVDRVNPLRLLMVFPRVFLGTHINHPMVHFYKGREISISGDTTAFADGERISELPVGVRIADQALQVFRL